MVIKFLINLKFRLKTRMLHYNPLNLYPFIQFITYDC